MGERLLIVGASGRAAAASAIRAGFEPFVIDLFADADTRRLCPTLKCDPNDYPHGFVELAKQAPPSPWMYTGGLENDPEVITAISETRPLWGNPPGVLEQVRDPLRLSHLLSVKGLNHPAILLTGTSPPRGEKWLRKPLRSSGGCGIRFANSNDEEGTALGFFHQRFVQGQSMSLAFATFAPGFTLLGYTKQLIGTKWMHSSRFQYAGSVGPTTTAGLDLQDVHLAVFRFGDRTNLRGVGNIDFIHDGEWSHVIEVNPRYPASMEVLELAGRFTSIEWHRKGFFRHLKPTAPTASKNVIAKGIYYAAADLTFPHSGPWDDSLTHCMDVWRRPDFADIPDGGSSISGGQPVLTLFAEAATEADCLHQLKGRAAELDRLFGVPTPTEADHADDE